MEQSTLRKLILGSGLRLIALVLSVLIGLVLSPYVIHTLGDELYGVWFLATSFVEMFSLLDLGLNSAVGRYVAAKIGTKDYTGINRYLSTGYYIFSGISGIALLIAGGAALYLLQYQPTLHADAAEVIPVQHAKAAAVVIIIMGAQFAINLPLQAIGGLLTGALRYDIATAIGIASKIVSSTVVFLTLYFGGGIIALAATSFICTMVFRAITIWFAKREVPQAEIAFKHFDKKTVKELFSYSVFAFIAVISEMFRFKIPTFIIGSLIGLAAVTHYTIAATLTAYFVMVISSTLGILSPVFARQQANNDFQAIRKTLRFAIKIAIVVAGFVGFGLIAWGHPFIERWMGKDYLDAYPWLVVLIAGYTVALCQSPGVGMLYGMAKHYFHAIVNSLEALFSFILGLILVQYYGCLGVAIASLIPIVLLKLLIQPWFMCHVIKESVLQYYWNISWTVLLCSVGLILPGLITWQYAAPNYPTLCLVGSASAILYLPVIFAVFTKDERAIVWNAVTKKEGKS